MWSVKNQTMWLLAKLAGYFSYQTRVMQVQVYNLGQKHLQTFSFFSTICLHTTSETELDYHQKVNVQVASRVAERLKTLGNQEISKKILDMLGFDGEYPAVHPNAKF